MATKFQSTPGATRRTNWISVPARTCWTCFNPRPAQRAGRTSTVIVVPGPNECFNPRPAQCAGRTCASPPFNNRCTVSIRARRNVPDEHPRQDSRGRSPVFQSAPGAMCRTNAPPTDSSCPLVCFNPRPAQCAGRTYLHHFLHLALIVSIRARRNAPDERFCFAS